MDVIVDFYEVVEVVAAVVDPDRIRTMYVKTLLLTPSSRPVTNDVDSVGAPGATKNFVSATNSSGPRKERSTVGGH